MLEDIIRNRRSVKPSKMNGNIIPDEHIATMLEMADWAPTHGRTEPWRFIVLDREKAKSFCELHAKLYQSETPPEKFVEANYEKLFHQADAISHLIITYMLPGSNPKIPEIEEVAAASAAVQNMLLYAEYQGIKSLWSTGGLTHKPAMKKLLQLPEHAQLIGLIYLGYAASTEAGKRNSALSDKVRYSI